MIDTIKFKKEHLMAVLSDPYNKKYVGVVLPEHAESLENEEYAVTFLDNGAPIACVGLVKYWAGRYDAWAFFVPGNPLVFRRIHRFVKHFLAESKIRRIEANASKDFYEGHRWLNILGFVFEGLMKKFGPNGDDHTLYSYVREEN